MDYKKKVKEIMEHGAVLAFIMSDGLSREFALGGVMWLDKPQRLRWCAVFPNNQSDVHEFEYDRIEVMYDRDVIFHKKGAKREVAAIYPYEESGLDLGKAYQVLKEFNELKSKNNNEENLRIFMTEAI